MDAHHARRYIYSKPENFKHFLELMKFHIIVVDALVNTYSLRYRMVLIIHVVYMISAYKICSTIICAQLRNEQS